MFFEVYIRAGLLCASIEPLRRKVTYHLSCYYYDRVFIDLRLCVLQERLATKQRELRDLTADRDTIREQLHTVQRQLQTVAREGELALVQEEQGVRKLAARVAVLRSNSGKT